MIAYVMAATMLMQSPPQQFDLICTGTSVTSANDGQPDETQPFNARLRLDLDRMVWCWGDCPSVNQVNRASPMAIFLNNVFQGSNFEARIDRATGLFSLIIQAGAATGTMSARCEAAPYTGVPQPRF
jgi:hypothetical protein